MSKYFNIDEWTKRQDKYEREVFILYMRIEPNENVRNNVLRSFTRENTIYEILTIILYNK